MTRRKSKKILNSRKLAATNAPYSQGVKAGNFIFVSGQVGEDAQGNVASGIEAQTRQALENLRAVLEEGGAALEDVVKFTIYMTDVSDYEKVVKVRREYFKRDFPASTLVEVKGLVAPEYLIEIEAVAYVG